MFGLGPMELLIIGGLGVLLFGKRLPEVGMSLGKSIKEFKNGVQGINDDISTTSASSGRSSRSSSSVSSSRYNDLDDREEATAPKFDPPAAEPQG